MPKIEWKGAALLVPVPVALVSCGTMEKPNLITIAWTGIINSQPPKTYISVRTERHSHQIISNTGEFVINLTTKQMVRPVDWCGVRSGRDYEKFDYTKLTAQPSFQLSCPRIAESPLSLECRVFEVVKMESHDMFLADIVSVAVEETLIDKKGKLHLDREDLLAYAHGDYFALGEKLGSKGFSVRKKPPVRRAIKK
jgi:flavin reductase (DIM6/NTAB) family NADH-FMN oxidoreductase RutF